MKGREETGYTRENPPTSGIVVHCSHMRKSGSDPAGDPNPGAVHAPCSVQNFWFLPYNSERDLFLERSINYLVLSASLILLAWRRVCIRRERKRDRRGERGEKRVCKRAPVQRCDWKLRPRPQPRAIRESCVNRTPTLRPAWRFFPAFEAERRKSYKGCIGTRYKCAIAPTRKVLNWCAVFSSCCVCLWDFQRDSRFITKISSSSLAWNPVQTVAPETFFFTSVNLNPKSRDVEGRKVNEARTDLDDFEKNFRVANFDPGKFRERTRALGGVVVRLLDSHLGEPGSIPGGVALGFSQVGIVPDDAAGWRILIGDLPLPLVLHSGATPYPSGFTLVGSL
ncbi:hypothetical protein PR048_027482 [Dryococelus australis]|uniref:Uncharacterized protein n=1 Tax=Dryococelus australis TaxID=614101 RepID=A0ABQ9GFL5_9NEOP|nr:hypothetical protein PR048_027482 [Dryococelus australis]